VIAPEDLAAAAEVSVDSSSEAHAEAAHAAAQRGGAVGLDEHVDVVAKDVELDDGEVGAARGGNGSTDHRGGGATAQRGDSGGDAPGDVLREAGREGGACPVADGAGRAWAASSGTPAAAAGGAAGVIQGELAGAARSG
jgi:hypothetical protein